VALVESLDLFVGVGGNRQGGNSISSRDHDAIMYFVSYTVSEGGYSLGESRDTPLIIPLRLSDGEGNV